MGIERYSVGFVKAASVAVADPYAELLAGAGSVISVRQITVTAASGVGGQVGLAHAFAIGTGTTVFTGVCHRAIATQPTGPARVNAGWSSKPTGAISLLKNELLPLGTGQSKTLWDWTVDGELIVEQLKSVVLVNCGSGIQGGDLLFNITWQEGVLHR